MQIVYRRCCGVDVHKKMLAVCISVWDGRGQPKQEQAQFGTMTGDLLRLAAWLRQHAVTQVGMESTGVYWKPVWNILEEQFQEQIRRGEFQLVLANAYHVKAIPGHKTDRKDGQRIAELLQYNLLPRSFVPPRPVRELRDLTRYRSSLARERGRIANRVQKFLEDANIKLAAVASDVFGQSGLAMLRALTQGETDPEVLADLARGRLRAKLPELEAALEGRITEAHRGLIRRLLEQLEDVERRIEEVDQDIARKCAQEGMQAVVARWMEIPGVKEVAARSLVAELGTDMGQFPTVGQVASWAGVCPGNNRSADKRRSSRIPHGNPWLRATLCQAAWAASRSKKSYLAAQFRRLRVKRGPKRAIIGVAHSILVIGYSILKHDCHYQDLGVDYFAKLNAEGLKRYYISQLESLGHKVTLEPLADAA